MSTSDDVLVGRYRLLQEIGAGGMGVVWRAFDERLGRDVAVKRLHTRAGLDAAEAEVWSHRAMREARITARLHHPHAVPVFDVVEHDGPAVPGHAVLPVVEPGRAAQRRRPRLPGPRSRRIGARGGIRARRRARAPASCTGTSSRPTCSSRRTAPREITDFGIAHAMGDVSLTTSGLVTGTPAYLAPEVARGADASPASDVFSLGSTLYTVLEGRPPFGTPREPDGPAAPGRLRRGRARRAAPVP